MKRLAHLALWLLLIASLPVLADTRASIDRIRINADESVKLVIDTDRRESPDVSGLLRDFVITANATGRNMSYAGGKISWSTRYEYELSPRRAGRITIPPLRFGPDSTSALVVDVLNATSAPSKSPNNQSASNSNDVFIKTTVDTTTPYAQQGILMTVKFYVGRALIDAALDQASIQGASMQQVGRDVQTTETLNERNFQVVTRNYWVVPDQAGRVRIPGARLIGTTAGGFFDEAFGDGIERVSAAAETIDLNVQAPPANASTPWLPLQGLTVEAKTFPVNETPVGQAARVVIEMVADGALAADLPELKLEADNAAQIYPEPAATQSEIRNGRMVATVTRAFSVLPTQGGNVNISMPAIEWWNIGAQRTQTTALPKRVIRVPGAPATSQPSDTPQGDGVTRETTISDGRRSVVWGSALLVLVLLGVWAAWYWHRQRSLSAPDKPQSPLTPKAPPPASPQTRYGTDKPPTLADALASGDLNLISATLCGLCPVPTSSLAQVMTELASHSQRDAVAALQSARWGKGDARAALEALRHAFFKPPEWRKRSLKSPDDPLPPLYPTP